MPLQRYVATVTLKPVTDGNRTFWHWESTFATPPGMERELRDMVAQGVYEAGFENLRRHLRQGGDLRPRRRAPRCRTALAVPTRRVVVAALRRRPSELQPAGRRGRRAPRAGEVRIRQRAIGVNFIDVYLRRGWMPGAAAAARRAGHGGRRHACSTSAQASAACCPATAWPTSARCPAPTAACAACRPTGSCACRPRSRTRSPPRCCSRASPPTTCCATSAACSAGTRLLVHAAAGGVGLLVCAWARRLGAIGARHRVERGEGPRRARARLRARDRDARLSLCRRGAARLRRRRRGDRRPRRRGARREPRRARALRPLDQPRPGQRPAGAARARLRWSPSR